MMQIYTGTAAGKNLDKIKEKGLGIMISPSPSFSPRKEWTDIPCALDNGAFQSYKRGFPFMADLFRATIDKCYNVGVSLDFIVCPDIVAGGKKSLDFSMDWAMGELRTVPRLALAVQDGMQTLDVVPYLDYFSHIFIGGSPDWKWATASTWIYFAHSRKKKVHVGQCGTVNKGKRALELDADSIDSTNFVRNQSWEDVDDIFDGKQADLFRAETHLTPTKHDG